MIIICLSFLWSNGARNAIGMLSLIFFWRRRRWSMVSVMGSLSNNNDPRRIENFFDRERWNTKNVFRWFFLLFFKPVIRLVWFFVWKFSDVRWWIDKFLGIYAILDIRMLHFHMSIFKDIFSLLQWREWRW